MVPRDTNQKRTRPSTLHQRLYAALILLYPRAYRSRFATDMCLAFSERHAEAAVRGVQVADLREPLPFTDSEFDFVLCNAVIQHIPETVTVEVTLPELVRVLRPGGVLQLMFKTGAGTETVADNAYGEQSVERTFALYDENKMLQVLEGCGCELVHEETDGSMGGFLYFKDPKPMRHCVFWARKS